MMFVLRKFQGKAYKQRTQLYALFKDLNNAFDTVNREALWLILRRFDCPVKLVNIIKSLHTRNEARVILGNEPTNGLTLLNGVRQGCVLAPFLFNLYMSVILILVVQRLHSTGVCLRYRLDGGSFNLGRLKSQR